MKKRIELVVTNLGDGRETMTKEESWYWMRKERDVAEYGFWIQGKEKRGLSLMEFFVPREFTELSSDPSHFTGHRLTIKDELNDYGKINKTDCSPYIYRWTRTPHELMEMYQNRITLSEIEKHQKTLMEGWLKLISVWMNESLPEIAYQLPVWEKYLEEELFDCVTFFHQSQEEGVFSTIQNPRDGRSFIRWLKISSCCVELLRDVCLTMEGILRIDKGRSYPCLYAGCRWMKYHHLASWEKVKAI